MGCPPSTVGNSLLTSTKIIKIIPYRSAHGPPWSREPLIWLSFQVNLDCFKQTVTTITHPISQIPNTQNRAVDTCPWQASNHLEKWWCFNSNQPVPKYFFSQVLPNRTWSSSPFFQWCSGIHDKAVCKAVLMPVCTSMCVLPSWALDMSQSKVRTPSYFALRALWRLLQNWGGLWTIFSQVFSSLHLEVPHFPHYSHTLRSCTLSALPHHPISKAQEEVYHLLHPDHPNTYSNSGNEVVSWVYKLCYWPISSFSFLHSGTLDTLLLLTPVCMTV